MVIKAPKVSAADRKALALEEFRTALARGDSANNWREVAEMLASCLPAPRVVAADSEPDNGFLPWTDYAVQTSKMIWPSPRITVMFSDGEVVMCQAATMKGKPINIGRGIRVAIAFYRNRIFNRRCREHVNTWGVSDERGFGGNTCPLDYPAEAIEVPSIDMVTMREGGEEWNAEIANAETAELRKGFAAPARPALPALAPVVEAWEADEAPTVPDEAEPEPAPSPAPTERQIAARKIYRVALGSTAIPMQRAA